MTKGAVIKTVLMYLVAFGLILFVLPRNGRFPYEFSLGKPWLRSELYAKYDIPLFKTDKELQAEKDSLEKKSPFYFRMDQAKTEDVKSSFRKALGDFAAGLTEESSYSYQLNQIVRNGDKLISDIYDAGVVIIPDVLESAIDESGGLPVRIISDNIGSYADISDIYTPKTAFEKFSGFLLQNNWEDFLNSWNVAEMLEANLFYDEETTSKIRTQAIADISATQGIFPAGSLIISHGETITAEKYRILSSFKQEFETRNGYAGNDYQIVLGQILMLIAMLGALYLYLYFYEPSICADSKRNGFILLTVTIMVVITALVSKSSQISPYVVPYALVPIIIQTFFPVGVTVIASTVMILIIGFFAPSAYEFVFLNAVAIFTAIYSANSHFRRNILFRNTCLIFIAYVATYAVLFLMQGMSFSEYDPRTLLWFAISSGFTLLSYSLIFICEKIFGFISDIRLFELNDTNQPLLRELSSDAPGTFQHSIQVANIAEEVIREIGGNSLLVRVGAMYHDIGKIKAPMYFTENVSGESPHDNLSCMESARIIIDHVSEGVKLAQKACLPAQVINFISTHHGKSVVQYFFKNYLKENPEGEADIDKFRYEGPAPFSKEMAVLMMSDSCEAASHSLTTINAETIGLMVDSIIKYQMDGNSYMDADITLKEISVATDTIKKKLLSIYHVRVAYPK